MSVHIVMSVPEPTQLLPGHVQMPIAQKTPPKVWKVSGKCLRDAEEALRL